MEIFDYLNKNENLLFSKLSKKDLEEIIYYINLYLLEYRKVLNFNPNDTFGIEIEAENILEPSELLSKLYIYLDEGWDKKEDPTILDGLEFTSPVLRDDIDAWNSIQSVCKEINKYATVEENCAAHVHIGAQILPNNYEYMKRFLLLWATYEDVIFRFANGEYTKERLVIDDNAHSCYFTYDSYYQELTKNGEHIWPYILENLKVSPDSAVRFKQLQKLGVYKFDNTIEFRNPNGTFNPIIWQNNINFFMKMLYYVVSDRFDYDVILRRKKLNDMNYKYFSNYDMIHMDSALEFCDLIFDNNQDKVYFLKQYLKNNNEDTETFNKVLGLTR